MKKISGILGLGLVVCFFLPWVSIGSSNVSGKGILDAVASLKQMTEDLGLQFSPEMNYAYSLYLLPLFGSGAAIMEVAKKNTRFFDLGIGISTLLLFVYALAKTEGELLAVLAFGGYMTIFVGFTSLLVGLGVIAKPKT